MHAGRKRRKPVQRTVKKMATEEAKSNPSKRHRDRLNSELEHLAALLPFPEEVTSGLDKLSILRLSVSYLRAKSFFSVALKSRSVKEDENEGSQSSRRTVGAADRWITEGELLLQALNGFVLVVTSEGTVFYSSHTVQDYLGFHQTDIMHQSVFELIHTEDQQEFRKSLHWALNPPPADQPDKQDQTDQSMAEGDPVTSSVLLACDPNRLPPENSSFLERSFVCRFRCLLDNSSGFLALNVQGRLKFLYGQNQRLDNGGEVPPQLALFAIATPLQPPAILEIRTKNMIFRTKHKLDFTPMACDAKGKIVLGYTEAELCLRGTGYQFIHAADMLYCAENHVRMIKTGESGLTVFRLLTKDNRWTWVQANARLVYKNGKPDYIIATQRPLVEEEGGEHLRKRSMHLPFTFTTGEALLYQTSLPIPGFPDAFQGRSKTKKSKKGKLDKGFQDGLEPSSLLGVMMRQDESVYVCQAATEHTLSFSSSLFSELGLSTAPLPRTEASGPWIAPAKGVLELQTQEPNFDPLLSTLDSLNLEGDKDCSNAELFNTLENLGLDAEDLELLLLDERMIRVGMDPDYIPSLNDLLTNDEILSYIHDSLEGRGGEGRGGEGRGGKDRGGEGSARASSLSVSTQALSQAPVESPAPPQQSGAMVYPEVPLKQLPVVQLSQQMQRYLNTEPAQRKADTWDSVRLHFLATPGQRIEPITDPAESQLPNQVHLSDGFVSPQVGPSQHGHFQQGCVLFSAGAQDMYMSRPHEHQQLQWQQSQIFVQLQRQCHFGQNVTDDGAFLNRGYGALSQQPVDHSQRQAYSHKSPTSVLGPTEPGSSLVEAGYQSGQDASFPGSHSNIQNPRPWCVDYGMAGTTFSGFTANGHYHGMTPATSSYPEADSRQQEQAAANQIQDTSTCFPRHLPQSATLERILGIEPEQLDLEELYAAFTTSASSDAGRSKKTNGSIPSSARVHHPRGSILPEAGAAVSTDSLQSCPKGPADLLDLQTTDLYF